MSFLEPTTLQLLSRNEGKIKSYESCFDIRAWSHDICTRDRYLKEWIRCDMPYTVVPLCAVTRILRTMSCRNRGRATPRCHVDCKSKVILDSICTSCHAMKQCLRNDQNFEKYFVEEELETSHWPCDRCLEALKGIKMFWRVIIDKVFNINVSKNVQDKSSCCPTNSARDVAKMWQKDLVQQAVLVKSITKKSSGCTPCGQLTKQSSCCKTPSSCHITKMCSEGDRGSVLSRKTSRCTINSNECPKCKTFCKRASHCDLKKSECLKKKQCRCISVRVKTFDAGCNTLVRSECEEVKAYRTNLEYLKKNYEAQSIEMQQLKNENCALKTELANVCNNCKWKSSIYRVDAKQHRNRTALVPKPFECVDDSSTCRTSRSARDAESEMVITMKNCKNENFKYVSLLQVLHKTNEPLAHETGLKGPCHKKEDPIELLNKVQTTLGVIFKREMSMSAGRMTCDRTADIEATYQSVSPCRSRSCTTLSSRSKSQCALN